MAETVEYFTITTLPQVEYITVDGVEYRRVHNVRSNSAVDAVVDDTMRATPEYEAAHPAPAKKTDAKTEAADDDRPHHRGRRE
jgi:hypothetical protein